MSNKVVAVLSGGGAKGAAHVGVIRALEDHNLQPDHYVGTSIGSVIAACFACGLPYEDVLQRITALTRRDVAALSSGLLFGIFARSLLRPEPFRETIAALVPAERFSELKTPLTVTAVDAKNGELTLLGHGGKSHVPLQDALYASCALPLYYPPAMIGDREYVDGGLRAVLPLDAALEFEPDLVVGVSVGPSRHRLPDSTGPLSKGLIGAHRRSLRIMMAVQTEEVVSRWRREPPVDFILVQPNVEGGSTFQVERTVEFIESGYRAACRELAGRRQPA